MILADGQESHGDLRDRESVVREIRDQGLDLMLWFFQALQASAYTYRSELQPRNETLAN